MSYPIPVLLGQKKLHNMMKVFALFHKDNYLSQSDCFVY